MYAFFLYTVILIYESQIIVLRIYVYIEYKSWYNAHVRLEAYSI